MDVNFVKPTERERQRLLAKRSVQEVMKMVHADRTMLLSIVSGGESHWRKTAGRAFKGYALGDDVLPLMFEVFSEAAGDNPKVQLAALERAGLVKLKLDRIRGLCRFIRDEKHMDEVLEKCITSDDEREAIRRQMVPILQDMGTLPQVTH